MPHVEDERILTQTAFTRLLEWLDEGADSQGERYLEIRRRLVSYFDRRNRPSADDLADETLNRVARALEQSGSIAVRPPARYCYVIARFVLLEDIRRDRGRVPIDENRTPRTSGAVADTDADDDALASERRMECLDRCLDNLNSEQRQLAIDYYRDAKRDKIDRRRNLAARLGISMNALGIRAWRIRAALETCLDACCRGR